MLLSELRHDESGVKVDETEIELTSKVVNIFGFISSSRGVYKKIITQPYTAFYSLVPDHRVESDDRGGRTRSSPKSCV